MIDPNIYFKIDLESRDKNHSGQELVNPYTGVLESPEEYPCIDLVDDSDEEAAEEKDVSNCKKRVWRDTGPQEWLGVYRRYMQQRLSRRPKPISARGKNSNSERNGFTNAGGASDRLRRDLPKNGKKKIQPPSIQHVKTVGDLKRLCERRVTLGVTTTNVGKLNSLKKEDEGPDEETEDLDSRGPQRTRNDNDVIRDIKEITQEYLEECTGTNNNWEDLPRRYPMSQELVNPYTGVLESPEEYPCIDLVDDSDEEAAEEKDVLNCKKRDWRDTGPQEWLSVYRRYMQRRLPRRPKPISARGKNSNSERNGFSNAAGDASDRLRRDPPKDGKTKIHPPSVNHVKTVGDLKRLCERRVTLGVATTNVGKLSSLKKEDEGPDEETEDLDSRGPQGTRNDNVATRDNKEVTQEYLEECTGTNNNWEDLPRRYPISKTRKQKKSLDVLKVNFQKRYNAMQLIKHSNICVFKWTPHFYVCYQCLHRFKDMQALRRHVQGAHSYVQIKRKMDRDKRTYHRVDITDLECSICNVTLNSLSELEGHLVRHGVSFKRTGSSLVPHKLCTDTFTCQVCREVFATRFQLRKHMDKHFFSYVRPEYNTGLPSLRSLKRHCRAHVGEKTVPGSDRLDGGLELVTARYRCNRCKERFTSDYKKLRHLIEEHSGDNLLFQCLYCPKIFMTVHWLTKHINCVHPDQLYSSKI